MFEEIADKVPLEKKSQWHFVWVLFCLFLIPLSSFLATRAWIIAFVFSVVLLLSKKGEGIFLFNRYWDLLFFVSTLIVGSFYSNDLFSSFKTLETDFSFFAIPFIFVLIKNVNQQKLKIFSYAFILGLIVASVICILNAVINYGENGNFSVFSSYTLTSAINSHPTYLAYYLIFAITFGLYLLYYQKLDFKQSVVISVLFFLFITLMLTGGQTTFIAMLLVLSFFIMKFLIDEKTRERKMVFVMACLMVVGLFLTSRLLADNRDAILTDSWERFILWESALKANPNFLLGVGTGDYKDVLNQYYTEHNLIEFATDSYNAHNQFIQIVFTNGILGLLAVIILIARPIYLSVKYNDVLGTLVFFPFIIYGMTEVFLGRYQGVVFFALLHQLFVSYYASLRPEPVSLKGA